MYVLNERYEHVKASITLFRSTNQIAMVIFLFPITVILFSYYTYKLRLKKVIEISK